MLDVFIFRSVETARRFLGEKKNISFRDYAKLSISNFCEGGRQKILEKFIIVIG